MCLCFRRSLLGFNAHNEDLRILLSSDYDIQWLSKYECYWRWWWWLCVCLGLWCDVKWWWQLPVCLSLPVLRPQRNHSWPWKVRKAACFDPVPSNISTVIDLSAADVTHVFLHCAVFPLEGDVHWIITSSLLDHAGHIHSYFPFDRISLQESKAYVFPGILMVLILWSWNQSLCGLFSCCCYNINMLSTLLNCLGAERCLSVTKNVFFLLSKMKRSSLCCIY